MSGHLRFCLTTLLILAGLSTSPASSNPFEFLFDAPPAEVAVPAAAAQECLPQPGRFTANGQHWVYRLDGRRKCWFQAAAGVTTVKRPVDHPAVKQRISAPEENAAALRKPKAVVDARAELPRPALVETLQPTPPGPRVGDVAPDLAMGAAALVLPAPIKPATDQLTSDHPMPPQVDVEKLLATASFADDSVGSSEHPTPQVAAPIAETSKSRQGWTAAWLGVLLMALGFVSVLSSSRAFAGAMLVGRFLKSENELPADRRTQSVQAEEPLRRLANPCDLFARPNAEARTATTRA